jgi:enamine deaminase RidA (YjgF/YER057c/UK114 family)
MEQRDYEWLTFENIRKCVEAAGGSMDDIFKVVVMLKEILS